MFSFRHAVVAGWVQLNPMQAVTVRSKQRGGLRTERRADQRTELRDVPLPRPVAEVLDAYLAEGRRGG
ncbi:hypothetical protein ACQEU6_06455 [Spirillospora sp. CA-108201]